LVAGAAAEGGAARFGAFAMVYLPGAVPLTSSEALNNATLPYGLMLADQGLAAIETNPGLTTGLNIHRGMVTNHAVADSLAMEFTPVAKALAT